MTTPDGPDPSERQSAADHPDRGAAEATTGSDGQTPAPDSAGDDSTAEATIGSDGETPAPDSGGDDSTAEARRRRALRRAGRKARELDSQPQLLALAERLRTRLPGDHRYGDTLSLSGRQAHQLLGKGLSAIQPQRSSVVNQLGLTALQLWQAASEAQGRGRGDRPVALLFTDLVGFSSWALKVGDDQAVELLRAVADRTEQAFGARGGRVVKNLGDGWMAVFDDSADAVAAVLDLQQRLQQVEVHGHRPQLRTGVHCGRPRTLGGDFLGVDVNITARVAEAARPGQVLVSEAAAEGLRDAPVNLGRGRRLRASGTPRELRVRAVAAE